MIRVIETVAIVLLALGAVCVAIPACAVVAAIMWPTLLGVYAASRYASPRNESSCLIGLPLNVLWVVALAYLLSHVAA